MSCLSRAFEVIDERNAALNKVEHLKASNEALLSFVVAMAEDSPDECVRNAARKVIVKVKPDWKPRP